MNKDITYSIYGELKYAILVCLVENPPVDMVEKEWHTESNRLMSPNNKRASATVSVR